MFIIVVHLEFLDYILILITAIIILVGAVFFIFKLFEAVSLSLATGYLGFNPFRYIDFFPHHLSPSRENILKRYFKYYNNLPDNLKVVFKKRLSKFIESKFFETRDGLILKEEMIVLISASAIQLTFGLSRYTLPYFKKIIIYPAIFFSHKTLTYNKGEVQTKGQVVLSWFDFIDGYSHPHDNFNLGLHEFSHALFISFQKNAFNDPILDYHYLKWRKIGDKEFFRQRESGNSYFRRYAQVNLMEFFAVAVEYFFESPSDFKKKLPELYSALSKMLSQDPAKFYAYAG